jgi:cysteine-rich repeat protein
VCTGTGITCTTTTCVDRACNGTSSCTVTYPSGSACDDGNACTYGETCNGAGGCTGGSTVTCTSTTCVTRTCDGDATCAESYPSSGACDDGNPCTYNTTCNGAGGCAGGSTVTCSDTACMDYFCDGDASCGGTPINEGLSCGSGMVCVSGTCTSTSTCGNGVINTASGETCDDYNTTSGDGCDSSCHVERYWVCDGAPSSCHRVRILFAIADLEDTAYEAAIAAITGGAVGYYNANTGTPSLAQMQAYDCVFTNSDYAYADPTTMGNTLASFVDWGGVVVIGTFSLSSGWPLSGAIMGSGYCPVYSPSGSYSTTAYSYIGDGTSPIHYAVSSYSSGFQNDIAVWGAGVADGHWGSGAIAQAYRSPDYRVIYSNGYVNTPAGYPPNGDWARLIANACSTSYYLGY